MSVTIASSGFVRTITKAFGAFALMPPATSEMIFALMPSRSSRLMPGLRATPEVTMQTSAPAMSSILFVPVIRASKPSIGPDSAKSSAFPCGSPSTTS